MADWRAAAPRLVLVVVLLVTNVALVGAMSTSDREYSPDNRDWNGLSEFRSLLAADRDVRVGTETTRYGDLPASDSTAVIVAPRGEYSLADTTRIRAYLDRGGTLVVAAESNRTNALLAGVDASARIDGRPLRDEQSNFRGGYLPVTTNVSTHPLVGGVEELTLNYAASVEPNGAEVLVRTPSTTYLDENRNATLDDDEPLGPWPVVTVESVGAGQVVLISDASVLTNALLERDGNRALAAAVVGDGGTVLLDQSRAGPLAPLTYALIVLRTSALAQFAFGVAAVGGLAVVALGGHSRLWNRFRSEDETVAVGLSGDDVAAYLVAEHPEWDDERVRRVTKAIRHRRGDIEDDD